MDGRPPGNTGCCRLLPLLAAPLLRLLCFASFLFPRRPWRGPLPTPPGPNTLCITCAAGSSLASGLRPAFRRAASATSRGIASSGSAGLGLAFTPAFLQPAAPLSAATTNARGDARRPACARAPLLASFARSFSSLWGAFSSQGNCGPSHRRAKPWGRPSASAPGSRHTFLACPPTSGLTGRARPATQASVSAGTLPDPDLLREPGAPPPAVVSPPTRQRSWHQPGGRASRQTEKAVCARRAPSSSKAHTDRIIQAQKAHEQGTCPWDACLSGGIPGGAGSAVRCLKFPPPLAKPLGDSQPAGGVGRGRGACGAHCPLASAQRRPDNPPPRKLPLQHSLGASLRGRCVPACVSPPGSPSLCDPPARRAPMSRSAHAASYLRPSVSPSVPPPFLWPSVPATLPANLPAPTPPLPVSP